MPRRIIKVHYSNNRMPGRLNVVSTCPALIVDKLIR